MGHLTMEAAVRGWEKRLIAEEGGLRATRTTAKVRSVWSTATTSPNLGARRSGIYEVRRPKLTARDSGLGGETVVDRAQGRECEK